MKNPSVVLITETVGDFTLELYQTQKGRFWAKAFHNPSQVSYISYSFEDLEVAVESAIRGCIGELNDPDAV
ncbi:MAG: hypothetical protein H6619_03795 [Deltaproteobacteria bacterium]|nr:hypothetical protein [Deltaproteobacteria bacterium]